MPRYHRIGTSCGSFKPPSFCYPENILWHPSNKLLKRSWGKRNYCVLFMKLDFCLCFMGERDKTEFLQHRVWSTDSVQIPFSPILGGGYVLLFHFELYLQVYKTRVLRKILAPFKQLISCLFGGDLSSNWARVEGEEAKPVSESLFFLSFCQRLGWHSSSALTPSWQTYRHFCYSA